MSVLLRVAYDGTDFHGYAAQRRRSAAGLDRAPGHTEVRTVQAEIERTLARLYKQTVATRAASRTDAGVHAQGQLVAFVPPFAIPPAGLARGMNRHLAPDLRVLQAWEELGEVDVRRTNLGKHYRYRIRCTPTGDPLGHRFEWHVGRSLDVTAMQDAADVLVGEHDFASFRSAGCQAASTVRTVTAVDLVARAAPLGPSFAAARWPSTLPACTDDRPRTPADIVEIHVRGRGFLYNMVRIIVGTLVDVGRRRRSRASLVDLLREPDRRRAGMTAPARGLTLIEVMWPSPTDGRAEIEARDRPALLD